LWSRAVDSAGVLRRCQYLDTGENPVKRVVQYLYAIPASAQDEPGPPKGAVLILTHRCRRNWITQLAVWLSPNTAPGPLPQECRQPLPRTRPAAPPAGDRDGSPPSLPTDLGYAQGHPWLRNSASTNTPAPGTPPHTTSRSPRNSATESHPSPTPASRTSNRLPGSNDADTDARSPERTESDPYTGNTSGREPLALVVTSPRERLRVRLVGVPRRTGPNRSVSAHSPIPTTRGRRNIPCDRCATASTSGRKLSGWTSRLRSRASPAGESISAT